MKASSNPLGRLLRLSTMAGVLLFAQQALAAGTDPGTLVENTATVDYDVNGNPQAQLTSTSADFVVDRRVDFTVTRMGTGLTPTGLGDTQVFVDFYVTNLSNGDLDFSLLFDQLTSGDGDIYGAGTADTDVDMSNVSISVSAAVDPTPGTGDGPAPVFGGPTFIDDLPEDQSIRVRLYADTPATLANGDIAGLRLNATAADPSGGPGANLVESGSWNQGSIDNVFANTAGADTNGNATEADVDGFIIEAAELIITKTAAVFSDPFGSGRAVPGAVIEYSIEIDNSAGGDDADNISIEDPIDSDVTFLDDVYNGNTSNVSIFDGAATTYCDAEAGGADTNSDGCVFDSPAAGTLTISGFSVPAGETWTVSFQVEIPTT